VRLSRHGTPACRAGVRAARRDGAHGHTSSARGSLCPDCALGRAVGIGRIPRARAPHCLVAASLPGDRGMGARLSSVHRACRRRRGIGAAAG
jgi:hypothetical protein